ncbi:fluoride efflux transporter CrcB [Catellatospora methionotrophica]|uniref:fluoride efflux transporter CrcB n=1 Tax=Catellatospora methionotrophica TaxID=121620 RepID=UPI0033F21FC2
MTVLLVALGAAVGAPLRYLVDRAVQARHDAVFPWGTFTVNVVGSFLLGLLTGGALAGVVSGEVSVLVGTGFCGALTTYSTFGYETVKLVEAGAFGQAFANVAVSVTTGVAAAAAGYALTV